MSLATPARRDQRRRLVASWNRSVSSTPVAEAGVSTATHAAAYDDDAHPDHHPALATRLPVSLGRVVLASFGILLGMGGAIALAVSGPLFGRNLMDGGGRFAGSLAVLKQLVSPASPVPLHTWLAVLMLMAAAAISGSIKLMRRHRRDDYKGRFRAWGWLATVLTVAAWSAVLPIGALVSAVMSEATGIGLGPSGVGWWYALAAVALVVVLPWAILPLRQRLGMASWTVAALIGWSTAAAMPWIDGFVGGPERAAVIASAAWAGGAAFLLVALLTAARGVIREVRGEVSAEPPARVRRDRKRKAQEPQVAERSDDRSESRDEPEEGVDEPETDEAERVDFTDGSDGGERRLSKAERKRLKKLARMNGHAA